MVTSLDLVGKNLAQNIVNLRSKRGLTQARLAQLAGATRASVALIESGTSNPTLEVLLKLSLALQVGIDELTSAPHAECKFISASEVPLDRRSKGGVVIRKILPDKLKTMEIDEISLAPRSGFTGSPHVEGTKEYFTCVEGSISIGVLGQVYSLKKGDVLAFPGDKPHSYKNQGQELARGISVVFFNPHSEAT